MIPIGPDIIEGPWGFWVPAIKTFEATIASTFLSKVHQYHDSRRVWNSERTNSYAASTCTLRYVQLLQSKDLDRILSKSKSTQSTVRKGYFVACCSDGGLETDGALEASVLRSSARLYAPGWADFPLCLVYANFDCSSLTMANHVIFMQPYHTSGENAQENYESAMTQAIGRARRGAKYLSKPTGHVDDCFTCSLEPCYNFYFL